MIEIREFTSENSDEDRARIARRVGERLCAENLSPAEHRAAEVLAGHLVIDAIEHVRRELSLAVRRAKFLAKDVAMTIACDVDSVSCPFLAVTDVFSDEEWIELLSSLTQAARKTVAGRDLISDGLACALADLGDEEVTQTLLENLAVTLTTPLCEIVIDRHEGSTRVLDALCRRDDMDPDIVAQLITKVSDAASLKLIAAFNLPDHTELFISEAETEALVQLAGEMPEHRHFEYATSLSHKDKLSVQLLMLALKEGVLPFFEASLSVKSEIHLDKITQVTRNGGGAPLNEILRKASIPSNVHQKLWGLLLIARRPYSSSKARVAAAAG